MKTTKWGDIYDGGGGILQKNLLEISCCSFFEIPPAPFSLFRGFDRVTFKKSVLAQILTPKSPYTVTAGSIVKIPWDTHIYKIVGDILDGGGTFCRKNYLKISADNFIPASLKCPPPPLSFSGSWSSNFREIGPGEILDPKIPFSCYNRKYYKNTL